MVVVIFSFFLISAFYSIPIHTTALVDEQSINAFEKCTVHLINYPGINIPPLKHPVLVSRHQIVTIDPSTSNTNLTFQFNTFMMYPLLGNLPSNNTRTKKTHLRGSILRGTTQQEKGWTCLARFYLFPDSKLPKYVPFADRKVGMILPPMFEEDWAHYRGIGDRNKFHRLQYHILTLKGSKDDFTILQDWSQGMNVLLQRNEQIELVVIKRQKGRAAKIYLACKYCKPFARTFIYVKSRSVPLVDMVEERLALYREIQKSLTIVTLNMMKTDVLKLLMHRSLDGFDIWKLPEPSMMADIILLKSVLQNVSLTWITSIEEPQSDIYPGCSYKRGFPCDRHSSVFPSISTDSVTNIALLKPVKHFTFLIERKITLQRVSLKGFVSVYHNIIWGLILASIIACTFVSAASAKKLASPVYLTRKTLNFMCNLIEQGDPITSPSGQQISALSYCWLITAFILTNAFIGDNIHNVIQPPKERPVENIRELVDKNYTFCDRLYYRGFLSNFVDGNGAKSVLAGMPGMYPWYYDSHIPYRLRSCSLHRVEEVLLENAAILGCISDLLLLKKTLESNDILRAHIGKEAFNSRALGWRLSHVVSTRTWKKVASLEESGIAKYVYSSIERVKTLPSKRGRTNRTTNARNERVASAIKLDSNISEIFILMMCIFGGLTLLLLFEALIGQRRLIWWRLLMFLYES